MRAKLIRGAFIAAAAMVIFWLGGFILLTRGSEWADIEAVILADEKIKAVSGGTVRSLTPEFLGYRYGFRGEGGYAEFVAKIEGVTSKRVELKLRKNRGVWSITRQTEL